MKTFGEWVHTIRRRNNMTMRDLEVVSGISNARISQIERGANPTLITAAALANSMDYKLWEVLQALDI